MILRESLLPSETKIICESSEDEHGKKNLYMKGIFIQGGVKNHNERVYPLHEIRNAVVSLTEKIKEFNGVLGELDHPSELTINLDRASHVITEMWMDGNYGMGKLRVLSTPMGNILRTLIESDVRIGVSSRGVGNVDARGEVSEYSLVTIDAVANPSAQKALPVPVYESFNSKRGRILNELAQAVSHDPKAQEHLTRELLAWINKL